MTEKNQDSIPFLKKITVKVTVIILIILSVGIGTTIAFYVARQNNAILASQQRAVNEESKVLFIAIRNTMLAGKADLAVDLFRDFQRSDDIGEIKLFRKNGRSAFSDNRTLKFVNKRIGSKRFKPKRVFVRKEDNKSKVFLASVKQVADRIVTVKDNDIRKIKVYKPLINQPRCSNCHGVNHVVRGVIVISSPIEQIYKETSRNILISAFIYSVVVFVLSLVIVLFLHRFVISRVHVLGAVVQNVGQGDFKNKVDIKVWDEIGDLANQINIMIDGLHEKFKLTRFVSKSTLEHVKGDADISLGGEKKKMTVLFTDIRNFTGYSESRDPNEVMAMLNEVMNLQGEVIHQFNGDIDKFVGDEIMAVFEGDGMVQRAASAALEIKNKMRERYSSDDNPIFVGIGINTGDMIAGNMGSGDRLDRTVIGDAVNLGARLCSIAGKNTIVISQFSFDEAADYLEVQEHDAIKVKGKSEAVKIYTLRGMK